MLDYLATQGKRPQHIYREVSCVTLPTIRPFIIFQIVEYIQSQPRGFTPLLEQDIFNDVHVVPAGPEPNLEGPRNSICRICATEILLWGIRDWWIRERKKGIVEDGRKDCPDGSGCDRQKDNGISSEFHVVIILTDTVNRRACTGV